MTDDDLPCVEMVELATEHLEGALGPHAAARVERHLAGCPGCTRYLDQLRTTVSLLGELPAPQLSSAARERLLQAFRSSDVRPGPSA